MRPPAAQKRRDRDLSGLQPTGRGSGRTRHGTNGKILGAAAVPAAQVNNSNIVTGQAHIVKQGHRRPVDCGPLLLRNIFHLRHAFDRNEQQLGLDCCLIPAAPDGMQPCAHQRRGGAFRGAGCTARSSSAAPGYFLGPASPCNSPSTPYACKQGVHSAAPLKHVCQPGACLAAGSRA